MQNGKVDSRWKICCNNSCWYFFLVTVCIYSVHCFWNNERQATVLNNTEQNNSFQMHMTIKKTCIAIRHLFVLCTVRHSLNLPMSRQSDFLLAQVKQWFCMHKRQLEFCIFFSHSNISTRLRRLPRAVKWRHNFP